ncbi:hydrolase [Angustibacter aerolatus]|uniref:Hydrolase n=1 Tax=Angustibacter aerolatus TaxID=1162965 RepID=A0ABQ6JK82_9ACTN|nr:metal-dependent hydrolase [Angustibacter aerolatus]GMA87789.1 hydrolase [Angustibacter aerolatus]
MAIVAAVEHFTTFLGHWLLNSPALDRAGADPVMLDLLRWHAAEEVEHRSVAFDLAHHLDRRWVRRARSMLLVGYVLATLWVRGTRFLVDADPETTLRATWWRAARAARRGLVPSAWQVLRAWARWFRPGHHPRSEGSTRQAVAYLAASPAARAAG